jgi:DedD protein
MPEAQDVNTLKRRGRRRLVGAIALVLVAVIILPWIFDPQPRQTPPVSVRIPNEDESVFKPVPKPTPTEAPKAAAPAPAPEPAPKPAATVVPKPRPDDSERARAEAALANALEYFVPVGAYAKPEGVTARLKAAKVPYFTEPVATAAGTVTRVRAGPFQTREAAQRAHQRIKALGFKPGSVASRS